MSSRPSRSMSRLAAKKAKAGTPIGPQVALGAGDCPRILYVRNSSSLVHGRPADEQPAQRPRQKVGPPSAESREIQRTLSSTSLCTRH
jgi:hypothetical protein